MPRIKPAASRHEHFSKTASSIHGALPSRIVRLSLNSNTLVKVLPRGTLLVSHFLRIAVLQDLKRIDVTGEKTHLAAAQLSEKLLSKGGHVLRVYPITLNVITSAINVIKSLITAVNRMEMHKCYGIFNIVRDRILSKNRIF